MTSPRSPPCSNRNSSSSQTNNPFRLASLLRPFQELAMPQGPQNQITPRTLFAPIVEAVAIVAPEMDTSEELTHVRKRSSQSFILITSYPSTTGTELPSSPPLFSTSPGTRSGLTQCDAHAVDRRRRSGFNCKLLIAHGYAH